MELAEFRSDVEELKQLHRVAKETSHMIELEKNTWTLFEPTKFVYTFFAFNTFYNTNWKNSLNTLEVEYHGDVREKDKITSLLEFICEHCSQKDFTEVFFNPKRPVISSNTISECEKIEPDRGPLGRVRRWNRDNFINSLKNCNNQQAVSFADLQEIAYFLFAIRNNIFHGTKTYRDMVNRDQRVRLRIYAEILASINELLFKAIDYAIAKKRSVVSVR